MTTICDSTQIASVLKQFCSALKADGLAPADCTGPIEGFIQVLFAVELQKSDPEFDTQSFIVDIQEARK